MPTPTSAPKPGPRPFQRANMKPDINVASIATMIRMAVAGPSAAMSASPTRKPSSATAQRSTVRTQNAMPACVAARAA